jgi:hypothetical protein
MMTSMNAVLDRFHGSGIPIPLYVPDLTLWYEWHSTRASMPAALQGASLPRIARAMGVPAWMTVRPWRIETPGIEVETVEGAGERVTRSVTAAGTLTARWSLGPDGDWWQTEYPVKTVDDLIAALALVRARSYVVDGGKLDGLQVEVGDEGILALQLPQQPYSELLHGFLGWGEGLMLLADGQDLVSEILEALASEMRRLVAQVACLPTAVVLAPDNLDGQFISPPAFRRHMAEGYRQIADALHERGKSLLVQAGGPIRRLLPLLASAGVDGVEGVAGPPQSDASLREAREAAGPAFTLWGGIPQDWLLETFDRDAFEAGVRQVVGEAAGDGRAIVGVADRVPVDADQSRLQELPGLIAKALASLM